MSLCCEAKYKADRRTFVSGKFKERILPLPAKPDDEQAWVERILLVRSHLEEDAGKKALDRLTSLIGYASYVCCSCVCFFADRAQRSLPISGVHYILRGEQCETV